MSEQTRDTRDLEAWAKTSGQSTKRPTWERWPQKAKLEIEQVLEWNDEGKSAVSRHAMCDRLRIIHSITLTDRTLDAYCRKVLGRQGWDKR